MSSSIQLGASFPDSVADLEQITAPIEGHLETFRSFFKETIASDVPLLDVLIRYLWRQKGKEIRPTLVYMTARLFGEVTRRTHIAATMIELLHTATLIHDDVVDEADSRRGFLSINRLWKNKAGVLLGDFLLSKGLLIALDNGEHSLLRITSDAVRQMSEGELRQLKTSRLQNMTEERYYQIISEKTASLIAACIRCGAVSALGRDVEFEASGPVMQAGMKIGMAFQIKDDLLDYGMDDIGKPRRNDIRERKVTLPLIKALANAEPREASSMRRLIGKRRKSEREIDELVRFVHRNGGVTQSEAVMEDLTREAMDLIRTHPLRMGSETTSGSSTGVATTSAASTANVGPTDALGDFERLIRFIIHRRR